jgi:hypothetical protein
VVPPATLVLPPRSVVVPPTTVVLPPATVVFPPATLVFPPATLVLPPATLVLPPATLVVPPATLVVPAPPIGLAPDPEHPDANAPAISTETAKRQKRTMENGRLLFMEFSLRPLKGHQLGETGHVGQVLTLVRCQLLDE